MSFDAGRREVQYRKRPAHATQPMRLLPTSLLAVVLLAACGGGDGDTVPFVTVAHTQHSGFGSAEHVVLRSDSALQELWARMTVGGAPLPSVDFASFQVVGVFLGSRPNGCYDVAITGITRTASSLLVSYQETIPAPGAACTDGLVTPAHLVAMARSSLPVEFEAE